MGSSIVYDDQISHENKVARTSVFRQFHVVFARILEVFQLAAGKDRKGNTAPNAITRTEHFLDSGLNKTCYNKL